MKLTKPFKTRLLAATGGAVVVARAAGGVAWATGSTQVSPKVPVVATSSQSAATAADAAANALAVNGSARRHPLLRAELRRVLRNTVHAELIVKTPEGYETVDIDRGSLTSVSSGSILITRPDGPTVSATITASTRFVGIPESSLKAGDREILVQTGGDAVVVVSRPPKAASSTSSTS